MQNAREVTPEYKIGQLDSFAERKVVPVEVAGKRVGVLRKGGEVYVFADHCPHQGGPMCFAQVVGTMLPSEPNEFNYDLDGLIVKCPWHAYEFDVRTGQAMGGIIRSRLLIYHSEVRGGEVFLQLRRSKSAGSAD
jgi:nitrite reductase/ring-hydroxylating ferredoxin subunit